MSTANEVGRFLEERVRQHGTEAVIFYNQLAAHFEMPEVDERWSRHPLCKLFGVLDEEDTSKGRPFRTVRVVSKDKNMPGQGFFNAVATLRQPKPRLNAIQFFASELNALAAHYSGGKP